MSSTTVVTLCVLGVTLMVIATRFWNRTSRRPDPPPDVARGGARRPAGGSPPSPGQSRAP